MVSVRIPQEMNKIRGSLKKKSGEKEFCLLSADKSYNDTLSWRYVSFKEKMTCLKRRLCKCLRMIFFSKLHVPQVHILLQLLSWNRGKNNGDGHSNQTVHVEDTTLHCVQAVVKIKNRFPVICISVHCLLWMKRWILPLWKWWLWHRELWHTFCYLSLKCSGMGTCLWVTSFRSLQQNLR